MNNFLCKIGLHKMRKVKSTKTTVMILMEDIIRKESKILLPLNDEIICRKFGIKKDTIRIEYDIYDKVCIKCGDCKYNVEEKRNELIEKRNKIARAEIKNKNKDRKIENIYKEHKNGS